MAAVSYYSPHFTAMFRDSLANIEGRIRERQTELRTLVSDVREAHRQLDLRVLPREKIHWSRALLDWQRASVEERLSMQSPFTPVLMDPPEHDSIRVEWGESVLRLHELRCEQRDLVCEMKRIAICQTLPMPSLPEPPSARAPAWAGYTTELDLGRVRGELLNPELDFYLESMEGPESWTRTWPAQVDQAASPRWEVGDGSTWGEEPLPIPEKGGE